MAKIITWFTIFGLSFLVSFLQWAEQEKAFLYIYIGYVILIFLITIFINFFNIYSFKERFKLSFLTIGVMFVNIIIILFSTWVATKLFNVDYYITFEIMLFGACLCSSNSSKKERN